MDGDSLPYRHIWRIAGEFRLSSHRRLVALFPADITRAVIFQLVARLSALDWASGGAIRPPDRISRASSISAIADALGKPFETVRRHVHALERDRLVAIAQGGVALAAATTRESEITAFLEDVHDGFVWLIDRLASIDMFRAAPTPAETGPSLGEILVRALDVRVAGHERLAGSLEGWHGQTIWAAIGAANVRAVVLDDALSRRFAHEATPDAVRQPVSLHAVAHAVRLPYATVWRHAQKLEAAGLARRGADGWVVGNGQFAGNDVGEALLADARAIVRKVRELVLQGLDPREAARRYIRGHPELMPFALPA